MLKRNFPLGKFQYNLPFAGILTLSSKASEINIRKEILQKPSFPRIKRKACQMSQETEIEDKIILYKMRCNFKTGNAKSISLFQNCEAIMIFRLTWKGALTHLRQTLLRKSCRNVCPLLRLTEC